ncbi:hypothetical protein CSUI_002794 [Cystoisospora suis]|uniref:Uncharacterized protein n=1 Tax=Cystoisospora suis TaxID=483139 RepID=A0A2C6L550_9APIC|nr:hypothetical protein CSUI_002794 [Cystoisospora suis]
MREREEKKKKDHNLSLFSFSSLWWKCICLLHELLFSFFLSYFCLIEKKEREERTEEEKGKET